MKRFLMTLILICTLIIIGKYLLSNYNIEYKLNNYNIITKYKKGRYYFEINNNIKYNFDIYGKRTLKKKFVKEIKEIKDDDLDCIYPIIEGLKTYPLCYQNNEYIDYNLIESDLLKDYQTKQNTIDETKDFNYYKNLDKNTYIALWNYKGYIVMNDDMFENIELFNKDRYDNSLSYQIDDTIYLPNYDDEHEFKKIISFNLRTKEKKIIDLGYTIDYDSYIVGNIKNKLYIFDNKHSVLYEINTKNNKVKIKGSNQIGYSKYESGEFVSCSKSEYKVNKIKFNTDTEESNYKYVLSNGVYKTINDNTKLVTKITNNDVSILKTYKNNIYYIDNNYLYLYSPSYGSEKIFYYYELEFNKDNTTFIYIK